MNDVVMSLDPAFANVGISIFKKGFLVHVECIKTLKTKDKKIKVSDDNMRRANEIVDRLKYLIEYHRVSTIVAEMPSGTQSARAATLLGYVSGLLVSLVNILELKFRWYNQSQIKKAIFNRISIDKEYVMEYVKKNYSFDFPKQKNRFEHIADSIIIHETFLKNN